MKKKPLTHEQMNQQNWRYKKKSVPVDEFAHLNGPVITRIPKVEKSTGTTGTRTTPRFEDSARPKHGVVKTTTSLPHPLKCSKCDYIATSAADSRQHWLDH